MTTEIKALLLRAVPEEGRLSIERFANELERAFEANDAVSLSATTVHAWVFASATMLRRPSTVLSRFVGYPLKIVRGINADIYHIADQSEAHLARFLPHRRTVVTCHDLIPMAAARDALGFHSPLPTVAGLRFSASSLKDVARIVCPSEATKRDVMRLEGIEASKIRVVPNGVGPSFRRFSDAERVLTRASVAGRNGSVLLSVSTGGPYKNTEGVLRVASALRAGGRAVSLLRVGRALNRRERGLAQALGIAGSIIELGVVDDVRLVELYNAVDALLFPSFAEGFGLPVLEAMACGTPIVASNCPALAELVADAGLTAAAGDTAGLAAAAAAILDSPDGLALQLRSRGLARAANFSWQRTAAGYAEVYQELCEEGAVAGKPVLPDWASS